MSNNIYVNYRGEYITIDKYLIIIKQDKVKPNKDRQNKENSQIKYKNADDFMQGLNASKSQNHNFYKKLVENNVNLIDNLDYHFWSETFARGSE